MMPRTVNRDSEPCRGLRDPAVRRSAVVSFTMDGRPVEAHAGESLAAALLAAGIGTLRMSPRGGEPRGAFCWMGLCQECTVTVDGVRRPACRAEARDGMVVRSGTIG